MLVELNSEDRYGQDVAGAGDCSQPEADTVVPTFALAEFDRGGGKRSFAAVCAVVRVADKADLCKRGLCSRGNPWHMRQSLFRYAAKVAKPVIIQGQEKNRSFAAFSIDNRDLDLFRCGCEPGRAQTLKSVLYVSFGGVD